MPNLLGLRSALIHRRPHPQLRRDPEPFWSAHPFLTGSTLMSACLISYALSRPASHTHLSLLVVAILPVWLSVLGAQVARRLLMRDELGAPRDRASLQNAGDAASGSLQVARNRMNSR